MTDANEPQIRAEAEALTALPATVAKPIAAGFNQAQPAQAGFVSTEPHFNGAARAGNQR